MGIVKEDGDIMWTSVSAIPVVSPDWDVVTTTCDITEPKLAEGHYGSGKGSGCG